MLFVLQDQCMLWNNLQYVSIRRMPVLYFYFDFRVRFFPGRSTTNRLPHTLVVRCRTKLHARFDAQNSCLWKSTHLQTKRWLLLKTKKQINASFLYSRAGASTLIIIDPSSSSSEESFHSVAESATELTFANVSSGDGNRQDKDKSKTLFNIDNESKKQKWDKVTNNSSA